jgi:hypothetical protein
MKLHSALQLYLDARCLEANKLSYKLNELPPYKALYKVHCSKRRDKELSSTAAAAGSRSAAVLMAFGRDAYAKGCYQLLASANPADAEVLSIYTAQVQTVARGDDLRQRKFLDLATHTLQCVGGCGGTLWCGRAELTSCNHHSSGSGYQSSAIAA